MATVRRRLLVSALLAAVALATAAGGAIYHLYHVGFAAQQQRLATLAETHARQIEAILRHEREEFPDDPRAALDFTLAQVGRAHARFGRSAEAGEFVLVRVEGNRLRSLTASRRGASARAPAWREGSAALTRRLLAGEAGVVAGRDERGVEVLAAYEPISPHGLGLIARMDLDEVRAPFVRAGLAAFAVLALLILSGGIAFQRFGGRLIGRAEESEARYAGLLATAPDLTLVLDTDGRILASNERSTSLLGRDPGALAGRFFRELLAEGEEMPPLDRTVGGASIRLRRADGGVVACNASLAPVGSAARSYGHVVAILEDAAERRAMEASLEVTRRGFREALENLGMVAVQLDREGRVVFANDYLLRLTGWRGEEVEGREWFSLFLPEEDRGTVRRLFSRAMTGAGIPPHHENPIVTRDGRARLIAWNNSDLRDAEGRMIGVTAIGEDVTERRRIERGMRESQAQLRALAASATDAIIGMREDGRIDFWNGAAERVFGYREAEALGSPLHELIAPARLEGEIRDGLRRFARTGDGRLVGRTLELTARHGSGREFPVELSVSAVRRDDAWYAMGIVRDVSERRSAELLLREQADDLTLRVRELECLREVMRLLADVEQPPGRVLARVVGRLPDAMRDPRAAAARITWHGREYATSGIDRRRCGLDAPLRVGGERVGRVEVVYVERFPGRGEPFLDEERALVETVARAISEFIGHWQHAHELQRSESGLREAQHIARLGSWEWQAGGNTFYGSGELFHIFGLRPENRPVYAPFRARIHAEDRGRVDRGIVALRRGAEQLALDFRIVRPNGKVRIVHAKGSRRGGPEGVRLVGTVQDVTERERIERRLRESRAVLKESLKGTILAISRAVEARDPYTAGHQHRVARLAVAVAREMGLDEESVEGISFGALIHDIGKIYLPAEILSKPSRLSDPEFDMIKTHSEVGYEILRDIGFPWPVAEIARQHHERLDGSGYPRGLKGEEILFEARIVAVADVVEAMVSHRPYRPARGVDLALKTVLDGRGTRYDAAAVDACITVVRERGFDVVGEVGYVSDDAP